MATQIQLRRGTAAAWISANPTLAPGEMGIETDTKKHKLGDGVTAWNSLSYAATAPAAHALGGSGHSSDTLENLNAKLLDATLIDVNDLDGYASLDTENQRWADSSQQRQDIRDALDGYESGGGDDGYAIHDNVAAEISAITEKISLAGDDLILIEDSEASNAKKKVKVSNLAKSCFHPIDYSFGALKDLTGVTWTKATAFQFRGSTTLGTPSVIEIVADQSSTSSDIRIYDTTNSLEICTLNFTNETSSILDLGTLSNIDADAAIWEVQYKEDGSGKVNIWSMHIY